MANYTVTIRHREQPPAGGASTSATAAFSVTGASGTLSAPKDPAAFAGPSTVTAPSGRITQVSGGLFGLSVTATEDASIEFEVAIGGGGYNLVEVKGALTGQRITFSSSAPNDGLVRHMRARHTKVTWTASAYTTVQDATPWTVLNPTDPTQWKVKAADSSGLTVDASVLNVKIRGTGTTPGFVVAAGAGQMGTAPTGTISGTDIAGFIHTIVGTSPGATGEVGTVTFTLPFAVAPFVVIVPASSGAWGLHPYAYLVSTTGFTITGSGGYGGAAAILDFYYQVIG
jgi:hypothetical protein